MSTFTDFLLTLNLNKNKKEGGKMEDRGNLESRSEIKAVDNVDMSNLANMVRKIDANFYSR